MARPRRVSVQGRGADLFFGDLQALPTPDEETQVDAVAETDAAHDQVTSHAPTEEQSATGEQASKHARTEAAQPDGSAHEELISLVILDAVWRDVAIEQATITNAFRYTQEELDQLKDAIYELGKAHETRVTKQEVARLGLNAILTDYQIRGEQSILSEFVARRKDAGR